MVVRQQNDIEAQLADEIANTYGDALAYVMLAFPWDSDPAIQVVDWENEEIFVDPTTGICYDDRPKDVKTVTYKKWMQPYRERFNTRYGPDKWACDWLDDVSAQVRKNNFQGVKSVPPIQMATASGHGIGKSTLTAWVILWIMSTRPYAKGTVTANTADQLRTKTWAELGKWHKRCINGHWFRYNSGRGNMNLKHNKFEDEWYCSAQTSREENSESFAGQHAANSTSFYIFDEASGIVDKIYEVREGGTTDGEPMVFDFGNPTRNSGRFFEECEGKFRKRFRVRKIDSRTVAITNKQRIAEWIEDYGIDSDFVKVRVLGEFPSAGSLQFIPTAWVQRAMMRPSIGHNSARFGTVTIGVDVARFGDDNSVIYPVVGNDARSFAPKRGDGIYHGLDNVQLAMKVIQKIEFFMGLGMEIGGVYVDVGGTGSGVVDTIRHSGYDCVEINFGTTPVFQPEVYRFRGDEMWGRCKEAIKTKLILPTTFDFAEIAGVDPHELHQGVGQQLLSDLTQREFGYTISGDKVHLESKKDMKARGLPSPDIADALVLNWALDVAPSLQSRHHVPEKPMTTQHEYDPLADVTV